VKQGARSDSVDSAAPAACLQDVEDWILTEGRSLRLRQLVAGFCRCLIGAGVPVLRCTVHIRQLNPQYYSRGFHWLRGEEQAQETPREHGIEKTQAFLDSPLYLVYERGEDVRRRLHDPSTPRDFPVLRDLDDMGATDYMAVDLPFRRGAGQALTLATDRPGGFSDAHVALVKAVLPAFSAVAELINLERMTRVLLQTYLGQSTGQTVVEGRIRRGDVNRIRAVLIYSDLRDFTQASESLPGATVIDLLNDYFETVSEPLTAAGGEILKFIGDAMLAILPIEGEGDAGLGKACDAALCAADAAIAGLSVLNARRRQAGEQTLTAGMALHVGDVLYGNIGTRDRLDFTVIGPAVNLVSRIEHLCGEVGRPLVLSHEFARATSRPVRSLGRHQLKGIAEPQEIFVPA
jgi:adenylate cyclase